MSKLLKVFVAVTAIVAVNSILSGCAFSKNSEKSKVSLEIQDYKESDVEIRAEVLEAERLHEYFVRFSWPTGQGWRVEIQSDEANLEKIGNGPVDIPIPEGQKKRYLVTIYHANGTLLFSKNFDMTAPRDLTIHGEIALHSHTYWRYNRVEFIERSRVILNGYNLTIDAESIESNNNGGRIETNSDRRFAPNPALLEGAVITLKAKRISGLFWFYLSGFMGKDGGNEDGQKLRSAERPPCLDNKPADGEPGGNAAKLIVQVDQKWITYFMLHVVGDEPGPSGRGICGGKDGKEGIPTIFETPPGTNIVNYLRDKIKFPKE